MHFKKYFEIALYKILFFCLKIDALDKVSQLGEGALQYLVPRCSWANQDLGREGGWELGANNPRSQEQKHRETKYVIGL